MLCVTLGSELFLSKRDQLAKIKAIPHSHALTNYGTMAKAMGSQTKIDGGSYEFDNSK